MDILNTRTNVLLRAEVSTLEDNMFRLKITEKSPMRPRYEVEGALSGEPKRERYMCRCDCVCVCGWERNSVCVCVGVWAGEK